MDSYPTTPKRKRNNPSTLHPPPWTHPTSPSESPTSSEPNSPPSMVANKLSDLHLHGATNIAHPLAAEGPAPIKRRRFTSRPDEPGSSDEEEEEEDKEASEENMQQNTHIPMCIDQDPLQPDQPHPPLTLTLSTTPPTPTTTTPFAHFSTTPPTPAPDQNYADLPSDDDGRGINGIGYRPTPAMAYIRAQKRKQQVLDWRAREAKEARQRRRERRVEGERTAGVVEGVVVEEGKGRVVRFA